MRSIIIMVVAIATGTFSCAQKKVNPPTAVITAFNKQFAGATKIKWEKEKGKYEAGFVQTNIATSALFSADGSLEETEIVIAATDLPAAAVQYARTKGKIKEATKITNADGNIKYEAEINGKDLFFDAAGNFIK